jgi:hypothetical protein
MSPFVRTGASCCSTHARKHRPLMGPSKTQGATSDPLPVITQSPEKGQRAPMAKRCEAAQARALRAPTAQRRHNVLDPGFVDENHTPGIEPGERIKPATSASVDADVRCRRVPVQARTGFFLKLRPSRRRDSHTALCETFTPRAASSSLGPCRVRCGVYAIRSTMNARCASRTDLR